MAIDAPWWFTDPARAAYPSDTLTGHRGESYRWELLTFNDTPAGTLDGVTDGTLDWKIGNTIKGGGSMTWHRPDGLDLTQYRIQPWYSLVGQNGLTVAEWPLGVFIPATPSDDWEDTGATVRVDLYDKLLILEEDAIEQTYTVQAGTLATAAVRAVILEAGQTKIAIEESAHTIRNDMVWPVGTTKLFIVNEILESIYYFSLWCDGEGVYRADSYTPPSARPLAYQFADDEASIYLPRFAHKRDLFAVPNRLTLIARTDGAEEAMVATAENVNAGSPTSYQAKGNRWVARTDENVEASSQAVLQDMANRRLATASQVSSEIDLEHALVPLQLNDAVTFRREPAGLNLRATVRSISITCKPGALVKTAIREVVS